MTYSSQNRARGTSTTTITGPPTSGAPCRGLITNYISPLPSSFNGIATQFFQPAFPYVYTTFWTSSGSVRTTSTAPPDASGTVTCKVAVPTTTAPFVGVTTTTTVTYRGATPTSYFLYPTGGGRVCTKHELIPNSLQTRTLYLGAGPLPTTLTATETISGIPSRIVEVIEPTCTNAGLRYYELANPYDTTIGNPFYPKYILDYFNNATLTANYVGYADDINFVLPWAGPSTILSMPQRANTASTLVFQGYFAPPTSGTWTFTLFSIDDVADMWMGQNAYTGWNTANRLLRGTRGNINAFTGYFAANEYIPITIVYANGPQTGTLQLGITDPVGAYRNSTEGLFKWPACAGDRFLKYPVVTPTCKFC